MHVVLLMLRSVSANVHCYLILFLQHVCSLLSPYMSLCLFLSVSLSLVVLVAVPMIIIIVDQ